MLLAMMLFYGLTPGWGLLAVPLLSFGLLMAAAGIGTLLAALTVAYRDFRHVVPFMIQLWMFATPSIFVQGGTMFGPRGRFALMLNPVHGLIVNFRAAVLNQPMEPRLLGVSLLTSLGLLL